MTPIRISPLAVALAPALPLHATGAQNLNINGITIDTASGKSLGSLSSQGGMEEFTKLQKELVMTIIKQLGIDFQSLPPQVRGQIEKPQTTNPQALASFSKGLDLADKGQFQAAAAAFKEAVKNDPGFALASGMARLMPHVNLGKEPGAGGNAMKAMRQAAKSEGQQHAHNQLNRMNQANRNVNDLGVSDGRGKKDGDAKLDAINLVGNQEETTTQHAVTESSRQDVSQNTYIRVVEDSQRDQIDNAIPPMGQLEHPDYNGFAAGYLYYCGSYYACDNVIASKNSNGISLAFRPVNEDIFVDVEMNIGGDMLTGGSTPVVGFLNVSTCGTSSEGSCDTHSSYYVPDPYLPGRPQYFWSWFDGSSTDPVYAWIETDFYYNYVQSQAQFSYSNWGEWYLVDHATGDIWQGHWVAGELTPAAQIPNSGSVLYSGGMIGYTQDGSVLEGAMNWTVNFSTRSVGGSFDNITKSGSPWVASAAVNGGWSDGNNLISASLTGSNIVSGIAKGSFFGPNAEELGGSWRIDHTNGDKGTGIFLGKPNGVPFNSGQ